MGRKRQTASQKRVLELAKAKNAELFKFELGEPTRSETPTGKKLSSTGSGDGESSSKMPLEQKPIPERRTGRFPKGSSSSDAKTKNPAKVLTGSKDGGSSSKMPFKQIPIAETQTGTFPERPLSSVTKTKVAHGRRIETPTEALTDSEDGEPSRKMHLKQIPIPEMQTERFSKGPLSSDAKAKIAHGRQVENSAGSSTSSEDEEPSRKMPLKQTPIPEKQAGKFKLSEKITA